MKEIVDVMINVLTEEGRSVVRFSANRANVHLAIMSA